MNRYQLAKLVQWAGDGLHTRKRLQKVVYLLQAAGCKIDAEYTLHHYGPYSQDVAQLADEMVQARILDETSAPNSTRGESFTYRLSDRTREQLPRVEAAMETKLGSGDLAAYEPVAKRLLDDPNLSRVEYAATIAYFRKEQKLDWQRSREAAARFKNQPADCDAMKNAEELARQVIEPGARG